MPLDIPAIRRQFPALALTDRGKPRIYLDNPAGTQVPQQVVDRISNYLIRSNANRGGYFVTARESDAIVKEAHAAMADLLNAPSPREVVFGPNMTSLTFQLSHSLARQFKRGDRLIVTRMDHDANVAPWLQLAEATGMKVLWWDFNPETARFDLLELAELLEKGKVVFAALCYASNALGTINDVQAICRLLAEARVLSFIDAVQYVPHAPTDVQQLGCDFLACSVYKFYGGHQGVLWGRSELLENLYAFKVRPAGNGLPDRFETGTQSHEGQAGTLGALEYLQAIGGSVTAEQEQHFPQLSGRNLQLHCAMNAIKHYEATLSGHLISGLQNIPGIVVHGITDPSLLKWRVPTISFTHRDIAPADIARRLAEENIFVWSGHYYAVEVIERLGLAGSGGMVRVGAGHYNTIAELDRLLEVLAKVVSGER